MKHHLALTLLGLGACQMHDPLVSSTETRLPVPPVARVEPHRLETHGDVRIDDYYWLRERESEEVRRYLEDENAYVKTMMAHTEELQQELYDEMVGRVRQDDETVPYRLGSYLYYTRYEEGEQYPIHCRRKTAAAPEEVLLDVNAMSKGHGFYSVSRRTVSPDENLLAYAVDTVGRRIYTIEVKDLRTGKVIDSIPDVTSNMVWAEDSKTLFYTKRDLETLRAYQIWRHELGAKEDQLVFEETDTEFSCFVTKTRSRRFLLIGSTHTLSTEWRMLDAKNPKGDFSIVARRRPDHEYWVDHHGDHLYIVTNKAAKNFRLVKTPVDRTSEASWEEVIPHRADVLLEDVNLFRDHMVVTERRDGLIHLKVVPFDGSAPHEIAFDEPAYAVRPTDNAEFDADTLRYAYESLVTPDSVYDHDMNTRKRTLMKRQEVFGGFQRENYESRRLQATARDGTRVPVSVVFKKPFRADGKRPLLLYGYGSYGNSLDARFSPNLVSLLDRGFVYAIAHIRGGQELGRAWYEDGKLLKKMNTFTDFIDCGRHLVEEGYTSTDRLYSMGGSAGGLLIGAVINMAPELFHGAVAAVPFVDVVTTMLDETIPLTTFEYDEWGNPNEPLYYRYMLSYSPYDQVKAQEYPHLLVTTGFHDSQVQYWEPAKWVAKLRAKKSGDARLLFKTTMEAGHGGASGRYRRYRDQALIYAFLLDLAPDVEL